MKEFEDLIKLKYYHYNAINGTITKRNGDDACIIQSSGKNRSVRYMVRVPGSVEKQTTAARLAWRLHYGEWPKYRLVFKDKDSFNIRISNMCYNSATEESVGKFSTLLNGISNESKRN
jgi:hypothetical protein